MLPRNAYGVPIDINEVFLKLNNRLDEIENGEILPDPYEGHLSSFEPIMSYIHGFDHGKSIPMIKNRVNYINELLQSFRGKIDPEQSLRYFVEKSDEDQYETKVEMELDFYKEELEKILSSIEKAHPIMKKPYPLAFYENFLQSLAPHATITVYINQFKKEDGFNPGKCYVRGAGSKMISENEYYTRKAKEYAIQALDEINNEAREDRAKVDFYFKELRYFINELEKREDYLSRHVRDIAIDTLIKLSKRYDIPLSNKDIYFDYFTKFFKKIASEILEDDLLVVSQFHELKGAMVLNDEFIEIFHNEKFYDPNTYFNYPFDRFFEDLLTFTKAETYKRISNFLDSLELEIRERFMDQLVEKFKAIIKDINTVESAESELLREYLFTLTKYDNAIEPIKSYLPFPYSTSLPQFVLVNHAGNVIKGSESTDKESVRSIDKSKWSEKVISENNEIKTFTWLGTPEQLQSLFDKFNGEVFQTDIKTLQDVFSGKEVKLTNKIKWLLNVKNQKQTIPEIISIFHFLARLKEMKLIKTPFNFYNRSKNDRKVSSLVYKQISNFFILSDDSRIIRNHLRKKPLTRAPGDNKTKINLLLEKII